MYFDAEDQGARNVNFAAVAGGVKAVTTGMHVLTLYSASRDLVAVGTLADPRRPPDVVRYDLRRPDSVTRMTDVNSDLLTGKRLASVEEVWYSVER